MGPSARKACGGPKGIHGRAPAACARHEYAPWLPCHAFGHVIDMADIRKYLKGVDFPADPDELQNTAKRNNAPNDVIQGFSRLPRREYRNEADVTEAMESRQTSKQTL